MPAPTVEREVRAGLLAVATLEGAGLTGALSRPLGVIFRRGKHRSAAADGFLQHLLNSASAAGLLTQIGSGPYAVTKHAAVGLAEWLAVTYGDRGIKVSVLCPQAVRTAMTADVEEGGVAGVDGMLEPEDVADCVVEGLGEERFLILPHPRVAAYLQRKVGDYDRWLRGMRRLQARFESP